MLFGELAPPPWPRRRAGSDLLLAFGLYAVLAYACIVVARQPGTIAVVWLANGAAIGLLASAPRERLLPMLAAIAAGNLAANLAYGDPLAVSLAFLLPNTAEVALGALLLRAGGEAHRYAESLRRFLRTMIAGALVPPVLGATIGAALLELMGFASFERVWVDWYIGAASGAVALLPLVLELRSGRVAGRLRHAAAPGVVLALAALPFGLALLVAYFPFPFVGALLLVLPFAFGRSRLWAFAAAPLPIVTTAVALAFHYFAPLVPDTPLGHAMVFAALLMAVLPVQVVAVLVARQRAVDALLNTVASRSDEIVLVSDISGVLRWASRAREAYRGTPNEQLVGRSLSELAALNLISPTALDDHRLAMAGTTVERTAEVEYPLRGRRFMRVRVQPALDHDGRQVGVLAVATDVTDLETSRRELEVTAAQLRASNESLEQFVRIASHDLREPMNTIQQFAQLIEDGPAKDLPANGQLWFAQLRKGAQRMKQLLDDVLQYVRLNAEPDDARVWVSLDELAAECRAALDALIRTSGATVELGPLGAVRGHRSLLMLMMQNLLANAIKFSRPGVPPIVQLHATVQGQELRLAVRDNGIGIPAERLAEIGQPFRRLHNRRKYDGTGLGLAITSNILERHGGRLEISSTPDEGSTFTAVLPIKGDSAVARRG
jgi:PAS domain S-box-containing protein